MAFSDLDKKTIEIQERVAVDSAANRGLFQNLIHEIKSGNAERKIEAAKARKAEETAIEGLKEDMEYRHMEAEDLAAEIVKQGGKPEENAVYNKLQAEIAQDGLKIQERELKLQKQSSPFFSEARKNIKAELKENKRQQRDSTFLGKMVNLMTADLKFTKGSASQDEEGKKDDQSFMSKMFGGLSKSFQKGFSILGKGLEKFKSVAGTGFKALLTAVGIGLLIKFLQSDAWKKIREWLKEAGPKALDQIVKLLKLIYDKVLKPVLDFFLPKFKKFFDDLLVFLDNPSWSGLGTLIGDNKIALAGLVALLAPKLFLKGLKLAFTGLKTAIQLMATTVTGIGKTVLAPKAAMGKAIAALRASFVSMKLKLVAMKASMAAALIPLAAGAAVLALVVISVLAFKDAIEEFQRRVDEGEGVWSALGGAVLHFFKRLVEIPSEWITSFIPKDFKDKWNEGMADIVDWVVEKVGDLFDSIKGFFDKIISPFKRALAAYTAAGGGISGMIDAGKALFSGGDEGGEAPPKPVDLDAAAAAYDAERTDEDRAIRQVSIDKLFAKEGEAGLDKVLENLNRNLAIEGTDKGQLASLIKSYEDKKAELEAARVGGGGNVNVANVDNSQKVNSQTTRQENISLLDPETSLVQAVNM